MPLPYNYHTMGKLFKHKELTPVVKRKLRERKGELEKEMDRIDVLLKKPTMKMAEREKRDETQ